MNNKRSPVYEEESVTVGGETYHLAGFGKSTSRKYAFLPCGHLAFESVVAAQIGEFKGSLDSSYSRLLNVET